MPVEKSRKPYSTSFMSAADVRAAIAEGSRKPAAEPLVPPESLAIGEVRAAVSDTTTDTRTSTPRAKSRATKEN